MEEVRWVTVDNVSVVALIVGPLLAVIVARMLDDRRARRARRMDVFRKLMATRRERLSFEHVSALNLVEVEFRDSHKLLKNGKNILKNCVQYILSQKTRQKRVIKGEFLKNVTDYLQNCFMKWPRLLVIEFRPSRY